MEIWEEGEIGKWKDEDTAKYFNEIAKYAMRRVMDIKRKQSQVNEEIENKNKNIDV